MWRKRMYNGWHMSRGSCSEQYFIFPNVYYYHHALNVHQSCLSWIYNSRCGCATPRQWLIYIHQLPVQMRTGFRGVLLFSYHNPKVPWDIKQCMSTENDETNEHKFENKKEAHTGFKPEHIFPFIRKCVIWKTGSIRRLLGPMLGSYICLNR